MVGVEHQFDATFGEACRIIPMTSSRAFVGSPDERTPPYTLIGIADVDADSLGVVGTRFKSKVDGRISGQDAVVSFSVGQFRDGAPTLKNDWIVELSERTPVRRFRIRYTRDDNMGRAHAYVEETK
jgi:hypothetical protein